MSWIKRSTQEDFDATKKILLKLAVGAQKFFFEKNITDEEGSKRISGLIDKIIDLIDTEFADFSPLERDGISIIVASTWCLSFLRKIDTVQAQMKEEGKL